MNIETFNHQIEHMQQLPIEKQKAFYQNILNTELDETPIRMLAYLNYACVFYYDGDFRKASEILEPFILNYQSYKYRSEMISCMNLMGVCCQCEGEYALSRFYYDLAYKVVQKYHAFRYLTYEYNNIALTYIYENNYSLALQYILLAEKYLSVSDKKMGAFVFLNKCDIYSHLNKLEEAEKMFYIAKQSYDCEKILPYDILTVGASLYYKMGLKDRYQYYLSKIMENLDEMYASEYIDACKTVCKIALETNDYPIVEKLIHKMDAYMSTHQNENKVGLGFEQLKYEYAIKIGNDNFALEALQNKGNYYDKIITIQEEKRITSLQESIDTQMHLQEAIQKEKQANHAKTQFLSNMSHDIRTPMNAVLGYNELIKNEQLTPKLKHYQEMIDQSGHLLLSIINNVLDMSRIESGKMELNETINEVGSITHDVLQVYANEAKNKNISFIQNIEISHHTISCDTTKIEQIFSNIISNAIKYTPPGGTITFSLKEIPCEIKNHITLQTTIQDTGIGMHEEYLPKLFDSFSRERNTTESRIPGTGLGMAIVKSLVDLMDGTIEVKSKVGKGTKFTITLTHAIESPSVASLAAPTAIPANKMINKRILLAEDNDMNAEIAISIFHSMGFEVDHAKDGLICVDMLKKEKENTYDIVFMDIQMPNMNGYEATKTIRQLTDTQKANIPIVAMTANAFTADRNQAFASGMNAYITKPISTSEIRNVFSKLLQG